MRLTQKGAMFGLDARIALAIFGALSVISGAALYSAIQESRVVSIITELDNVGKATTAYYLDTGIMPASSATGIFLDAEDLITSGPTGWQGPYLSFTSSSTSGHLNHTIYEDVSLIAMEAGTAWAPVDVADTTTETGKCLNASSGCAVYACISDIPDSLKAAMDLRVDGTAGATAGKLRYAAGADELTCMNVMSYDEVFASE